MIDISVIPHSTLLIMSIAIVISFVNMGINRLAGHSPSRLGTIPNYAERNHGISISDDASYAFKRSETS